MCQLSVINLNKKSLNSLTTTLQLLGNSSTSNKDGYGIFTKDFFYKTELSPGRDLSLGKLAYELRPEDDNGLLLGHVRLATFSNGSKKICEENSHPFITKRFLLAHNGSLEIKNTKDLEGIDVKDKIDSNIFALKLQQLATANPKKSFPELIKECTDLFYGKFAFLVADKKEKIYYAVRGSSANLFISYLQTKEPLEDGTSIFSNTGYVINTDRGDLVDTTDLVTILHRSLTNEILKFTTPTLLDENTVFRLDDNKVENVGKVEETKKYVPVVENFAHGTSYLSRIKSSPNRKLGEELSDLCNEYGLNLDELEHLFFAMFSSSMTETRDRNIFVDFIKIVNHIAKNNFDKRKKEIWEGICGHSPYASENYTEFGLQFPYFLNSFEDLKETLDDLNKQLEEKYNVKITD